ncbi:choice-of-anchor D domain-containing protein [Bizionia sp. KMM 8389]
MKQNYPLIVLIFLCTLYSGFGQTTDLIISEYAEGSSNNKYIEIYNGTGNSIDLSNYQIYKTSNGSNWGSSPISLSGTLINNDVYVIANPSSDAIILAAADLTNSNANWNGDDAIGLAKDISGTMTIIDVIGVEGQDPGSGWAVAGTGNATKDKTLVRKSTICTPNTNWSASAGNNTIDSEWIVKNQNDWDDLGIHTANCSPTGPNITASPTTLTGLDYVEGTGPSAEQSFDINGVLLTAGIAITAPTNFEISRTAAGPYSSTLNIPLADANGSNTIYTRLVSGLPIASYSGNITMTNLTAGVSTMPTVAVSGEVNPPPTTELNFANSTYSINENGTAIDICVDITNPYSTNTTADIILTSANTPHLTYTTQGITFPANSTAQQCISIAITDNTACGDDTNYTFELDNVSGGSNAVVGSVNETTLSVSDDDMVSSTPFNETFSNFGTFTPVSISGDKDWIISSGRASINGYGSDIAAEDYLISASVDMSSNSAATLDFELSKSYTGPNLQILYSTNFNGNYTSTDVNTATWISVPGITITNTTTSVSADVLAVTGTNVYFAFYYTTTGTGAGHAAGWTVDDLSLNITACVTPEPEIEIQGNGIEIVNGATSPNTADDTDFGNVAVAGGTNPNTFTIHNTGSADLDITSITSSNTTEFAISGATLGLITPGNSASFTVTFNPNTTSPRTATITVNNDDADESSYTFDVAGNGTNSNQSTIIDNTTYSTGSPEFNSTVEYINFIDGSSTNSGKFIPMKLKIVDGPDADGFETKLTDISFTVEDLANADQLAMIKTAILTTTGGTTIATASIIGNELVFSGMNNASLTAADDDEQIFHLRVSLDETQVIDNTKLVFKVTSATADASGSSFAAADASGAETDTGNNNRNRLNVTADRLAFTVQPTSTSVNTNLNTFNISAVDQFGNIDLDDSLSITLTTSGVGMTSSSPYSLTNGDLAISDVQFNTSQTNINLTATTSGLAFSNTTTSTNFDILDVAVGTYRTTSNGTWPSGTATWEKLSTTGWNPATPAANTTELLIIRHTVTSRASFAAPAPRTTMVVENGGSFDDGHNSTFGSLLVKDGGTFIASAPAVDIDPTGTLTVENGGTFVINSGTLNNADGLWEGTENFYPESTLEIQDWDWDSSSGEERLIDNSNAISLNSDGYYFGHIYFNATHDEKAFTIVGEIGTHKLCNNLTINNRSFLKNVVLTDKNANIEIKGHVEILQNKFSFGSVGSSNLNHTVKGNLIANGGIIDINQQSAGAATVLVNLEGDLIGTAGTIQSTDGDCGIAFTGSTLQNIDVADTVPYKNINTYIKNNAEVQLLNNNLKLNNASTFTVENGGSFHFNWAADASTPLLITNGGNGSNTFNSNEGSILKITHLDGLVKNTANAGNVQLSVSNKTFNQTASFHYLGKDNQVTGDGISTGSTGKLVYVNLSDNSKTLSLTNNIGIANAVTLDPNGGKLEIQKGIVIGTNSGDFYGSGRLVMSDGEYRISTITSNQLTDYLPQLQNYSNYDLTGGIVHLNGVGLDNTQILSGVPNYVNLSFSGSNILAELPPLPPGIPTYKGISRGTNVSNNITISEDAIVDIKNWSLGGSGTNLIMEDQGRFIMAGAGTKPDATGNYSFAPNTTIEFNSDGGFESVRLSNPVPAYANIVVSGSNVGTIANGSGANSFIQFQPNGSFTVTGTGTFKQSNTNGFSGLANTSISDVNNPVITLLNNSTIEYQGANQNITHFAPEYKNLTISGSGIKTLGHPTDITIGEDLNLVSSDITINTNEAITVDEGLIITGGNLEIEDSGSLIQVNDTDTNSGDVTVRRNAETRQLDYIYWSSPVVGYPVNTVYGSNTPTHKIYRWDTTITNPNGGQGNWVAAAGETMQPGVGYIVRGPGTYTETSALITATFNNGKPFNGLFSIDVSRGSNTASENDNWNLVGNPYPSAIDVVSFLDNTTNSTILDGFVNIWTHGNLPSTSVEDPFYANFQSNYSANDYITYNASGSSSGPSTFGGKIAAGQSFMVNMLDGPATTQPIEFRNNMRSKNYDNSDFFRTDETPEKHRIWLDLVASDNSTTRIMVGYITNATDDRDRLYDAVTDNQSFYSLINNKTFTIQGRKLPFSETDRIPLGVKVANTGSHTIAIAAVDGLFEADNQTVYLRDNLLNITHNLKLLPYSFTSVAGNINDRFEIVYTNNTLSVDSFTENSNTLSIVELSDNQVQFRIDNNALTIKEVEIIDLLGRRIYQFKGNSQTEVYNLQNLSNASYLARVTLSNNQVVVKKAIKK